MAFETGTDVDAALAVAILDYDEGAASEAAHSRVGQQERIVTHGGDDFDIDEFASDERGCFTFYGEVDGTREAGYETIAGGDSGQLGDVNGKRLILRPTMDCGDLLADDEIGDAGGLAGDDQFDGVGLDDDDERRKGGHVGTALWWFQGAAHAIEADADSDNLAGKRRTNAAFFDLPFEGGDSQFGAGNGLFEGWVDPAFDFPQVHLRQVERHFLESDLGCISGFTGVLQEQLGAAGFELGSFQIEGQFILVDPEDAFGSGEIQPGLLQLFEQVGHDELSQNLAFFSLLPFVDKDGTQFPVNGEGERFPA